MIKNKQLSVLHAASTDSTRFNLNSVRFEADGSLVATDGHILAVMKAEGDAGVGGLEPFGMGAAYFDVTGGKSNLGACVDRDATNGNGSLRVTMSDGSALKLPKLAQGDEGFYPDWKHVMPKGEVQYKVGISLHVLERACQIARQASETRKGEIRAMVFEFGDEFEPIKVTDPKEDALTIVLMPTRL